MRRLLWLSLVVLGCATSPTALRREEGGRVYALSEVKAREEVRAVLARRGLYLEETANPHALISRPKTTVIQHATLGGSPGGRPGSVNEVLYTEQETWLVTFEAVGENATVVRVLKGEQLAWANAAERSGLAASGLSPVGVIEGLPLPFTRDRELEAAVAAELDSQAAVEVTEEVAAGAVVAPLDDPAASSTSAKQSCSFESKEVEQLVQPGHFVLLSDPLGAQEPWVVLDGLACDAAVRQVPLTVALSIPGSEQAAINTWLASAGTAADRAALVKGGFWSRPWQDGRSSIAVVDALDRLRRRRAEGMALTVLAVDSNAPGNPRYAHIAATLLRHREANPTRAIVAMLGNALTTRRVGAEWNTDQLPVGARLAAVLPESTHALDVSFWEGSHWTCHLKGEGRIRCGVWALRPGPAQASRALTARPYFRVFDRVSKEGFDGVYFVGGALTPSVPVVESLRVDEGTVKLRKPVVAPDMQQMHGGGDY
jgi:hypothetical protein